MEAKEGEGERGKNGGERGREGEAESTRRRRLPEGKGLAAAAAPQLARVVPGAGGEVAPGAALDLGRGPLAPTTADDDDDNDDDDDSGDDRPELARKPTRGFSAGAASGGLPCSVAPGPFEQIEPRGGATSGELPARRRRRPVDEGGAEGAARTPTGGFSA